MAYTDCMPTDSSLKKMLASGSLFKSISESAPFGLFVSDTNGDCIYANDEYLRITGLAAAEIPGPGWSLTIHPEDRPRILEKLYTATETNASFICQYRVLKRDGTLVHIMIRAAPIYQDERVTGFVGAVEDISLRLKMEGQLRINFAAMESSTSMIMITDALGLISWVNPAFSHGTGYSFDEVIGKNPGFLTTSADSSLKKAIRRIITTGQPWKGEIRNRRKDGSTYLEEEIITPILGTDGKISHFLAIKRDITEQRENELKLAEYSEHLEDLVRERTRELEEAQQRIVLQLRLEQDLEIAAQIQLSLLPDKPPAITGFDIAGKAFAAHYISGDLYDFVIKDERNLYILMADISGKGIPAALLAASARTTVREKILLNDSPAGILDLVNRTLASDLAKTEMFITMMLARIDTKTGLCTYSNAGHTRTMHYRSKSRSITMLGPTSLPIGVFPDIVTKEEQLQLADDDILCLYSDGLTEASNHAGQLLGEDALAEAVILNCERPAPRITEALITIVDAFSGNALPDDDRSVIIVKRQAEDATRSFALGTRTFEEILALVRGHSRKLGETFAEETELVMTELLTNIIRHAYGLDMEALDSPTAAGTSSPVVDIRCTPAKDRLVIDVFDRGRIFATVDYTEPDPLNLQVGGYGYLLIRKLTDTVIYAREADGRNHWHLEKSKKETK